MDILSLKPYNEFKRVGSFLEDNFIRKLIQLYEDEDDYCEEELCPCYITEPLRVDKYSLKNGYLLEHDLDDNTIELTKIVHIKINLNI
jgi:hypothetical protein